MPSRTQSAAIVVTTMPIQAALGHAVARLLRSVVGLLAVFVALTVSPAAISAGYTIDKAGSAMSGLWWNPGESGWGTALTQQYGMIFVAVFTYDASRKPIWYFASSCPVSGNGCTGALYSAKGGKPLSAPWGGASPTVTQVGTVTLAFSDANTGTMTYSINGTNGSRSIVRNVFATGATSAATDYSGIWWNSSESGWGMTVARQNNMNFATIYSYDASGNPTWYVASSCPVVGAACSGALYSISGGAPLTSAWSGSSLVLTPVGTLNLSFSDLNTGTMAYTLNGANGSRAIARQVFASPPAVFAKACGDAAAPAGMNYAQSGGNVTVTTNGCIALPAAGMCSPSSPQSTGINVLVTGNSTTASLGGITFNLPGMSSAFDASSYANVKTCIRNAPAGYSELNISYDVCYDVTAQLGTSLAALQASGMVSVSPPITVRAQGNQTMKIVADCTTSGADGIVDAVSGQVWIKQGNGSYLEIGK